MVDVDTLLREASRALDDMLGRYQAQGLTSIKAQAIATQLRAHLANAPAAPTSSDEPNLCWKCGARKPTNFAREDGCSDCGAPGKEPTRTDPCDECGAIHGPGNTNRLCPRASDYSIELERQIERQWPSERTDHERAVLDACAAVHVHTLVTFRDPAYGGAKLVDVCRAELARREAEK
jgi:hypothetical protein